MPNFIMICGPQAVGKMTVGQELAKLTGYKLFYNHMTIELVRLLFEYDKDVFWKINIKIRDLIFEEFSKSNEKGIIFTGCFDFGDELKQDKEDFERWVEPFKEVFVVELEADLKERLRRNKTENRLEHKPSKRDMEMSEKRLLTAEQKHKLNS